MQQLLAAKNCAILELDRAQKSGASPETISNLAARAGKLEEEMAEKYLELENPQQAAINYVSAASCFKVAGDSEKALGATEKARIHVQEKKLRKLLDQELTELRAANPTPKPKKPASKPKKPAKSKASSGK